MIKIEIFGCPVFKKGKKIHIKKKNRGKFTASAKKAGKSVLEHARDVLNDPNATPLQKKRANFARNAAKWKHDVGGKLILKHATGAALNKDEEDIISDKERKLAFLEENRKVYNEALRNIAHKRAVTNVLLNEGYATNMINLGYTMNPDSLVIGSNPEENPGRTNHAKLGNFGLDYVSNEEAASVGISKSKLKAKKAFDNYRTLPTVEKLSLNLALPIINTKINNVKRWLYAKYGAGAVSKFFRNNPGSEDRVLYAGYKMPMKMQERIEEYPTIEALYNKYITGGLNNAFIQVDKYRNIINGFFNR